MRFIYNSEVKIPYSLIDHAAATNWSATRFIARPDVREWLTENTVKSELRTTKYGGFKIVFTNPEDAFAFKMRWL